MSLVTDNRPFEIAQQPYGRVFNFSAGPAVQPLAVLEQIREDLMNYKGKGMSVMEMSHRSAAFEEIIFAAEADLRTLLNIPASYKVLFLQGGASTQFSMIPQNFLGAGRSADYLITGEWAQKASKEAKRFGTVRVAGSSEASNFDRIPKSSELDFDPNAVYVHFTSNNTIYGTQWRSEPQGVDVPLMCDASSDMLSRPLDITKYGLWYGGAQKNAGIAGATIVVMREDLLESVPNNLPSMLDYRLMADKLSLYNTPPTFAVYVSGLVINWLLGLGGLSAIAEHNQAKANLVYAAIDASGGFYRGHSQPDSRSLMNITFRLPDEDLDKKFVKEATAAGLDGLKGYRTVGGIRASMYNALPLEAAQALAGFMDDFRAKNG